MPESNTVHTEEKEERRKAGVTEMKGEMTDE